MPDVRPSVLRFNFLENICGSEKHPAHTVCGEIYDASVVCVSLSNLSCAFQLT